MSNVIEFLLRLKMVGKGGAGLPAHQLRDVLLAEHMGAEMHAKLNQVYRARRKRGAWS